MDDASLREVIRYLSKHFPRLSIEPSHMLTATEHGFRLRGEVNGTCSFVTRFSTTTRRTKSSRSSKCSRWPSLCGRRQASGAWS